MTDVFVVRNQLGHYWGKAKIWVDGSNPRTVMRTRHEDEAINSLFELSSKDIELRGEVIAVTLTERSEPIIEPSENPLPEEPEEELEPGEEEEEPDLPPAADTPRSSKTA
jgi:hypothetical protein